MTNLRNIKNVDEETLEKVSLPFHILSKFIVVTILTSRWLLDGILYLPNYSELHFLQCCTALFEKCRRNFSENVYIFEAFVMQHIFNHPPHSSSPSTTNADGDKGNGSNGTNKKEEDALIKLRDKHTALNLEYLYMKAASEQKDILLQEVQDAADLTGRVQDIDRTREEVASTIEDLVQLTKNARGRYCYFMYGVYM